MTTRIKLHPGCALVVCAVIHAAEPAPPGKPATRPVTTTATADSTSKPKPRAPLDLRIGDVRNYMMPSDFQAAMTVPDADSNTIVVQGTTLVPMKSLQPIPAGFPPATLWWALRNPARSWRIVLPDLNAPAAGKPDPVPPPVFRWGP